MHRARRRLAQPGEMRFPGIEPETIPGNGGRKWWEKLDLNQRSLAATDLQSAPIDRTLAFSRIWRALQDSNPGLAD